MAAAHQETRLPTVEQEHQRSNRTASKSASEAEAKLPAVVPAHVGRVQRALVGWYEREGRDLPWRRTRDPYAILVSEIMLQQTQVERVLPKWQAWLTEFPSLEHLARASRADVIRAWSGLGYNLRAVRLHEIARQAVEQSGGQLPDTLDGLLSLKGIGHYTAGAVACFAFDRAVPMVDTNVRRVLGRVFLGLPLAGPAEDRAVRHLAEQAVPVDGSAYAWNQGLMDLGATVCTVSRPACLVCPLLALCRAAPSMGTWPEERRRLLRESRAGYDTAARQRADEQRYYRGRIVEALREPAAEGGLMLDEIGPRLKPDYGPADHPWLRDLLDRLVRDGLIVGCHPDPAGHPTRYRLPS